VSPSDRLPPSIVTDLSLSAANASAISGTRLVQSRPFRLSTRTRSPSAADEAEAVVFDLVNPLRTRRHGAAVDWQAGLDKAGRVFSDTG
jgi:hypothetical protein